MWGNRQQEFHWINEYYWDNDKKIETTYAVICEETWEETDRDGNVVQQWSRHAGFVENLSPKRMSITVATKWHAIVGQSRTAF
jgi:hypothetical protein